MFIQAMRWLAIVVLTASSPAIGETITLVNGDQLNVTILEQTDTTITIAHPVLGTVTLQRDQLAEPAPSPEAKAAPAPKTATKEAAEPEAEPVDTGLFGTGLLVGWDHQVELGVNGAEGNSRNLNLRAGYSTQYEDDADRWQFDMVYSRAESSGTTSEDKFYAELTKDWLLPDSPVFYFANGRLDLDKFKDWDSRLSGAGGVGYQFVDDGTWNVKGRAGLGGSKTFGGQNDDFAPEAVFNLGADWTISANQTLSFTNTLYPILDDIGEFRNISTLAWTIKIDKDNGLSLKLGLENEYDSQATGTTKENDFKYFATLLWAF